MTSADGQLPDLSGRFGLRLAVWYATLFVTSWLGIVVLTYFLTASSLEQRDRQILDAKLGQYATVYARGGLRGLTATVDFFGVRRVVRLELVDEPVAAGDYVLNHVGYAIRRIPEDDIGGTLALYEQLLREAEDDLMAADVRGEIAAAAKGES